MSANKEEYEKSHLYRIRHSTAHVMAEAVLEKFPTGRVAIGPPIEDGFYYDFDLPRSLTPEDLAEIEERMKQLIAQKESFNCEEISAQDARKLFADQPFKLELIEGLENGGLLCIDVPHLAARNGNLLWLLKPQHLQLLAGTAV